MGFANMVEGKSLSTCFKLEYPRTAAKSILDNSKYLQTLVPEFGWEIEILAGYTVLPPNYELFDQRQAVHFQGITIFQKLSKSKTTGK